jgi:hypothetical protein
VVREGRLGGKGGELRWLERGSFIANRYVHSDISIAIKWRYRKMGYRKWKFSD